MDEQTQYKLDRDTRELIVRHGLPELVDALCRHCVKVGSAAALERLTPVRDWLKPPAKA